MNISINSLSTTLRSIVLKAMDATENSADINVPIILMHIREQAKNAILAENELKKFFDGINLTDPYNIIKYKDNFVVDDCPEHKVPLHSFIENKWPIASIEILFIDTELSFAGHEINKIGLPVKDGIVFGKGVMYGYGIIPRMSVEGFGSIVTEINGLLSNDDSPSMFMPTQEEHDELNRLFGAAFKYMKEHKIICQMNADASYFFKCDDWGWDNRPDDDILSSVAREQMKKKNLKYGMMADNVVSSDTNKLTEVEGFNDVMFLQCECPTFLLAK